MLAVNTSGDSCRCWRVSYRLRGLFAPIDLMLFPFSWEYPSGGNSLPEGRERWGVVGWAFMVACRPPKGGDPFSLLKRQLCISIRRASNNKWQAVFNEQKHYVLPG